MILVMWKRGDIKQRGIEEIPTKVGHWTYWKFTVNLIPKLPHRLTRLGDEPCAFPNLMGIWILPRESKNFGYGYICMNLATYGWPQSAGCMEKFPISIWVKVFPCMTGFRNRENTTSIILIVQWHLQPSSFPSKTCAPGTTIRLVHVWSTRT